jgi:hypothetical protein
VARQLLLAVSFVSFGFVAGLVLTGRLPGAADSRAEPVQSPPTAAPPAPRTVAAAAAAAPALGVDFTRVAAQAVKGVANISSVQVVQR